MRRILLGGIGLALGVCCSPAFAQPTPAPQSPPTRAAQFGRPTAIPDARAAAPSDPDVTQAGLLRRSASPPPTVPYVPAGPVTGAPVTGYPSSAAPVPIYTQPGTPMPGVPMMTPPTAPGMGTGQPMVTEMRDPMGVVPSVLPGYPCPEMEDPLYGGGPLGGLDRVRSGDKWWVSAEALLWWTRGTQVPPLVTTSSPQFNGIPGRGDTQVLLGGSFGDTYHIGGRFGAGWWFGDNQCHGLDGRVFFLSPQTATFSASVPPYPLLARPFINVNPTIMTPNVGPGVSAEVVAGPGVATGSVTATMQTTVWGAEVNYRHYLAGDACARLDWFVGYRYLGLKDRLTITETFARVPGSDMTIGGPAVSGVITDSFRTENHFHGGQIGLAGELRRGRWSLDARAAVALGAVCQSVDINGSQQLNFANGTTTVTPGGLLAIPGANIGVWRQTKFAVVPEVGINFGYQVTDHLRLFVGYNFLYLSSAIRPGGAIDPYIDAARVPNLLPPGSGAPAPGAIRPAPQFNTTGFFVQGISFGLVYKW